MKKIIISLLYLVIILTAHAQHKKSDTLLVALKNANTDTARLIALMKLSRHYYLSYPDSGIIFAQQGYHIAEKNNWISAKAFSLKRMADAYGNLGDYVKSMQYYFKSLRAYESVSDLLGAASVNNNIGSTYVQKEDYKNALAYLRTSNRQLATHGLTHKFGFDENRLQYIISLNLGEVYFYLKNVDSAEYYLHKTYGEVQKLSTTEARNEYMGNIHLDLGEVAGLKGNKKLALRYFSEAVSFSRSTGDIANLNAVYLSTAKLYHKYKQQDSAKYFAHKAIESAIAGKFEQDVFNAGKLLYSYYDEDHNLPEAYKYYKIATVAKDSLYNQDKVKQLLSMDFEEKQHQQDILAAREQYRDKVRMYSLIAGLVILVLLAFIFWRNSRQRQRANLVLQSQKEEIEKQKKSVDLTLAELRSTQTQLIQREKMASLGELTAGIAHEIQNPLNFVNNFSEVNTELLAEMEQEIEKGDYNEVRIIAENIKKNQQKISQHGRRADFIVKGMLEHSRTSTGEKELTNLNVLCSEFLKLSYHGLRAKDKSFNAELVTQFDPTLPKANIAQQDMGRVLLNLFNNAFYAVNQKQKTSGANYKPEVAVSTFRQNGSIIIKVKDNGGGIPDSIKEKIMQPFFTTKPTGEGTGLGLSLSYDIVVKGNGGSITMDTKEGESTEFVVTLPM